MDEWPWLNKAQSAELVGLKRARFDEAIKPRLKKSAIKGTTRALRFDAVAVVRAWDEHQSEQRGGATPKADPTDSELERGRAIENDHKRLRLMKDLDKVVEVAQIRPGLMLLASSLRDAGARLIKRYGNDAGDILNEGIKAGEREIASYFDRIETECPAPAARNDSGKRGDPAPNDAAVRRR